MLPNLRILVIRHLCTVGHLLNVRYDAECF